MAYIQPNTQAGEELARLFSRNMTLQQQQQQQPVEHISQLQPNQQSSASEPIKYSITQHYHHSSHIVHYDNPTSESQRASTEPQDTSPSVEQVLKNHGIDPSCLSPEQIELFSTGDTPQQTRLIQLWQICPPAKPLQATPSVAWMDTTTEDEDARRDSVMSLDGTPLTPVQTTEGYWVNATYIEPYMMSGYEMLARREYEESANQQLDVEMTGPKEHFTPFGSAAAAGNHNYRLATDPAYVAMENQYGVYQQSSGMQF